MNGDAGYHSEWLPALEIKSVFLPSFAKGHGTSSAFFNSSAVFFRDLDWQGSRRRTSLHLMKQKHRGNSCMNEHPCSNIVAPKCSSYVPREMDFLLVSLFPFVSCSALSAFSCHGFFSIPGLLPPPSSLVSGSDNFRASLNFSSSPPMIFARGDIQRERERKLAVNYLFRGDLRQRFRPFFVLFQFPGRRYSFFFDRGPLGHTVSQDRRTPLGAKVQSFSFHKFRSLLASLFQKAL